MMNNNNNIPDSRKNNNKLNDLAPTEKIVVIGASTGGFEAFKTIVKNLPPDFRPPIFIVWHISPDVQGLLPKVLNGLNKIESDHALDNEEIKPNRIYVAPPDDHLIIEDGRMRIAHGPKENRFRPAVDPLFRSAAYAYWNRVIGVILTGGLDDGTAGLWTVKRYGGVAIVQDPKDAEMPSMPENAMREVKIDYCVPLSKIAELLVRLSNEPLSNETGLMDDDQTKKEIAIAAQANPLHQGVYELGELTPFTCPECHGVLTSLRNDNIVRYRCHTGHAYSVDSLMAALTERIEDGLYNAVRGIDESIMLLNHLGDHYAEANRPKLAALYFKKAKEAEERSEWVRRAAFNHEQLSKESLRQEAKSDERYHEV